MKLMALDIEVAIHFHSLSEYNDLMISKRTMREESVRLPTKSILEISVGL